MKLNVNFNTLHEAVRAMGARIKDIEIDAVNKSPIDPVDAELERGIHVGIEDIELRENGLLSYKNRQVLLYIQDHGWNVSSVLQDGSKGKKYHIAYCKTLEKMNLGGRYNRYVVKHDISGLFYIDGVNSLTREHQSGEANLSVCKNCLNHLNYKNYSHSYYEKHQIFDDFSLEEFFKIYQQYFPYKPKYKAGERKSVYSENWKQQSRSYRYSVQWQCEKCQVELVNHKDLLHTHHINGVKSDNSPRNLKALCIECHANEPNHQHMIVENFQKKILKQVR